MKIAEYAAYDALGLAELVTRKEVTPKELALTAANDVKDLASPGNGSGSPGSYGSPTAELPALGGDEGGGESR